MTKTETPPNRGMGRVWIFLLSGRSTAPSLIATNRTAGVRRSVENAAIENRMRYLSILTDITWTSWDQEERAWEFFLDTQFRFSYI